ncbi:hypothetical protein PverR02_19140 [Pseudomonas veronii]|nr:hypothetical protein PverR02_19140 [Pseudomonas veronii]
MKKVVLVLSLAALAACSSSKSVVTSTDPNWLRIGDEPEGYPRTFVEKLNGNCSLITESWSKGSIKGQNMWTKEQSRKPIACP